ncbi:hypothetical protein AcV7_010344 [Taiwanofungus camphoratus]|nr:hypothetical protein AcV7_010344 [Antrodia cinnamomea]
MASSSSSSPEISAAPVTGSQQSSVQYAHLSREEVLEELSSRFILNLPEEELASLERVCFQVEQAHWYYEDFIREQNPAKFPSYSLKTFSEALFRACPPLHHWAHDHERAFETFMQYKTRVPVCGAIMLNDTWEKCVLVKGWKSSAGWGFPKGKINEQEPRPRCAVREVLEETGYDLDGQIVPEDVIELSIKEQSISLYIVSGIPEDFPFKTRTRKEISKIAWFKLSDLPTWRRSKAVPGKFYLISPFIGPLKAFINGRRPRTLSRRGNRQPQTIHDSHVSSEEDSGIMDSCPIISNDNIAQESSSQSSSADNGEPQTPSPQYSAARVNQQTSEDAPTHNNITGVESLLNMDGVDPHFARLLNSLSLSASASTTDVNNKSKLASGSSMSHQSPSSSNTSATQAPLHCQVDQSDWSVRVPGTSLGPSPSSFLPSQSPGHFPLPPTAFSMHTRQQTPVSFNAHNKLGPSHADQSSLSPGPFVAVCNTSPNAVVASTASTKSYARASHRRRNSRVSADISPYLSRPPDILKEMRYISMLENVVKESDRMSSRLEQRASPMLASQVRMAERSTLFPSASASVPPSSMYGGRIESPVIYSSAPVASTLFARPPASRQMPAFDAASYDDPFTVRPRTSAAFHPSSQLSHAVLNLTEDQLRFMIPGVDTGSRIPTQPQATGIFEQSHQLPLPTGLTHNPPHAAPIPHSLMGQPPLRVIPPQQLATPRYGEPPPLSAPALSPSFNLSSRANASRSANNAHLLSILNTPSTAPRAVPMQSGVLDGMGPR